MAKKRGRPKKEKPMADQSPPQKQQAPPPPAQQPAQGQPPQPQGAPAGLTAEHQQALAAAGIDWSKLQNLPWGQIFALVQAIMQILAAKGPPPTP